MRVFNRLYGVKPGMDAPKMERLLWFRGYYLRSLALGVPAVVLVVLWGPTWFLAFAALGALPWLLGFARLNVEIRRERQRG
jgi:hypothetical protein